MTLEPIKEFLHRERRIGLSGVKASGLVVSHGERKTLNRWCDERWRIGVTINAVFVQQMIERFDLQAPALSGKCGNFDLKCRAMVRRGGDLN